ncbi:MAG: phenylphosphate carboxylase subunit delta [Betaproteobacteria bacterium]|nr:phenylphosphate carboxylase subunit delta [Betaproteobacteria bacterium]
MSPPSPEILQRARRVRLMVFDVDGVLTDGVLWYGAQGEMFKAFHTLDGHGLKMLAASGVRTAILSGRESPAVARRAAELGVAHVLQGIEDKGPALAGLLTELGLAAADAGCMGDDVVDLPMLGRCGFACAPAGAHGEVLRRVHYVSVAPAGRGAAREVCDLLMRAQGTLAGAIARYDPGS